MPDEHAWPTQPFPVKPPPFARQNFTADDLSTLITDPAERARIKDQIRRARNEGLFTPPGLRGTIQMPGNNGGANWGGAAVDPTNGTLYVMSKDLPCILKLVPAPKVGPDRYESGFGFMSTSAGVSPIAPPWTSITAYDLNAGTIKWQVPLRQGASHQRWAGRHGRRLDLYRNLRQIRARPRRTDRQSALGDATQFSHRRNSRCL